MEFKKGQKVRVKRLATNVLLGVAGKVSKITEIAEFPAEVKQYRLEGIEPWFYDHELEPVKIEWQGLDEEDEWPDYGETD